MAEGILIAAETSADGRSALITLDVISTGKEVAAMGGSGTGGN